MAGEFVIGNMVAKLSADTSDFIKDMSGAANTAKKFQKDAGAVEQGGKKISSAFSGIGTAIQGFLVGGALTTAAYALVNFMKSSVVEAEDAARAQAQLAAVIKSTGGAAGVTARDVNGMAGELSELTGVEDDLIIRNSALMLTFTKVGEEVFPEAMEAALNMSAVMGTDLQGSVMQLGKALQDPVEGLGALRRVGVMFTDDQEKVIKSLVETGKVAEAQRIILGELKREFGGAAQAMHEAGSKADDLKNAWGNLKEEVGKGLLPVVGDANSGITGLVNTFTGALKIQNDYNAALEMGIITQAEYNTLYNARSVQGQIQAQEMVNSKIALYNQIIEDGIELGKIKAGMYDKETEGIEGVAEATEEVAEANKRAEKTTKDWMDQLDTSIDTTIANWLDELEFMAGGGGQIQAAAGAVKQALLEGKITPAEATSYWNELYVAAQNLKVDMGEITADEAAKNIRDTLNVSLQDAKDLIEDVRRRGQFNITSTINVKVKWTTMGQPLPWAHTEIPKQHGGPVSAGVGYLVGEAGPELFIPPVSGKIVPNYDLGIAGEAGEGGGDTYNEITINNYNQMAAALSTALVLNGRMERLNVGM